MSEQGNDQENPSGQQPSGEDRPELPAVVTRRMRPRRPQQEEQAAPQPTGPTHDSYGNPYERGAAPAPTNPGAQVTLQVSFEPESPEHLAHVLQMLQDQFGQVKQVHNHRTDTTHDAYGNPYDPTATHQATKDAYGNPY